MALVVGVTDRVMTVTIPRTQTGIKEYFLIMEQSSTLCRDIGLIASCLRASQEAMDCLEAVRSLELPDAWISAGFVRNRVWDRLHGFRRETPLNDIDLLFFDPADASREHEAAVERRLAAILPGRPFEARNQARMHLKNGDAPYVDTFDALFGWMETPTAIAVRVDDAGTLHFLHPFGIDDLMMMQVRPTPRAVGCIEVYNERMAAKRWPEIWIKVRVLGDPPDMAVPRRQRSAVLAVPGRN